MSGRCWRGCGLLLPLMGLGFVVARFGLFLRQLTAQTSSPIETGALNLSSPLGISMVAAGLLAMALATVRFLRARDQTERGSFQPEAFAMIVVVVLTLLGGAALLIYLVLDNSGRIPAISCQAARTLRAPRRSGHTTPEEPHRTGDYWRAANTLRSVRSSCLPTVF